ncbi:Stromal membrane-associated protein 1 [Pseudolycoriella hygida]|uniref:Stromal membrane-associated protein 1 n=1 Tax=Pseudolycoriella hygida TaxID=35572 RepID=A0A9Q0NEE9_9DIPT|nr:Stromal membrane-associated protein 1 [Pseudolycoriella hygida]
MSTRKESERTKFIQEKCQALLTQMLRDEDNKYCVDCDAKGPRWASWNLGVFLCIRCAGIHRNLGVHISRVRSVNLDTWTPEQVVSLQQMGNSRARAVYEAQLPDGFRRPQTDSALESFIRAKYEHKKYMAREWVPAPPAKANWDKEIDEEMEKLKRKKKSSASLGGIATSISDKKSTVTVKSIPIPAPLPKPKVNSSSPKTSHRVTVDCNQGSMDLLGLSLPASVAPSPPSNSSTVDLSSDVFSNFLSAPTTNVPFPPTSINSNNDSTSNTLAKEEKDFFNQAPNDAEKARMTKDSILALYGTAPASVPSIGQFNGGFNQFGAALSLPVQQSFGNQFGQNHNFITTSSAPMMNMNAGFPPQIQQQAFASFPSQGTFNPQLFGQPSSQPSNVNNINQQFGNLNLGNVWQ